MIIQNAVRIIEDGNETYLVSLHRHDFKTYTFKDGRKFSVDGGNEYIRRIGDLESVEGWNLNTNSPAEDFVQKLLWGTSGLNGEGPIKFIPLNTCSKQHLEAILQTCTHISDLYRDTIKLILTVKNLK